MLKYIILFFSLSIFLFSCKEKKDPASIIDHNRMINLLTDVHITDGSLQVYINPDSLYKYGTAKYVALFKTYHTDSVQFRKSLIYYSTKPDELLTMYDQILKNLNSKKDSLEKVQERQNHGLPKK